MVAVFPLTETFTGSNLAYESAAPTVQTVPVGENRPVKTDITDMVKGWLANPSSNHGVVIGALVGPQAGDMSLKSSALAANTALRLTFFYQNRSRERVSSK